MTYGLLGYYVWIVIMLYSRVKAKGQHPMFLPTNENKEVWLLESDSYRTLILVENIPGQLNTCEAPGLPDIKTC
jgi:hypothetical protein